MQFTRLTPRCRPVSDKAQAIILYNHGLSMNAIGKLLGVSATAVLNWIINFDLEHYSKREPSDVIVVELDEMHHYLKKEK